MEQENATLLLQFWLTAENFRSQLSDPMHVADIERDTADAIAIYERWELPHSCQHGLLILLCVTTSENYCPCSQITQGSYYTFMVP